MSKFEDVERVIDAQLERSDLTADDVLKLTIARRLNRASDSILAQALGDSEKVPLNFWNKR